MRELAELRAEIDKLAPEVSLVLGYACIQCTRKAKFPEGVGSVDTGRGAGIRTRAVTVRTADGFLNLEPVSFESGYHRGLS